jgi:hypothetical protein
VESIAKQTIVSIEYSGQARTIEINFSLRITTTAETQMKESYTSFQEWMNLKK